MAVFTKERPDYPGRFSAAPAVAGSSGTLCGAESCPENNVQVDLSEIYFLIMHFLSNSPCQRAFAQLSNDVLQHKLLPRRFHALPSRGGKQAVDGEDDGLSSPLSYDNIVARYILQLHSGVTLLSRCLMLLKVPVQLF